MESEPSNMSNSNKITSSSISLNFIQPIKLDWSNYFVWKAQVRASIIANGLEGFINGDNVCPNLFLIELNRESSRSRAQGSR